MSAHYNVILAGQYGVGKTSIFRRLQHCERMEDSGNDRGLDRITYLTKKGDKDIEVRGGSTLRHISIADGGDANAQGYAIGNVGRARFLS